MPEKDDQAPRIIVDSDWKEQARREKEEADRQTREIPALGELPAPSMLEIVEILAMQATVGLGGVQDPRTGKAIPPNLPLARHCIDLLELLRDKVADRIDPQETQMVERTLHELRIAFVQIAAAASPAAASAKPPA